MSETETVICKLKVFPRNTNETDTNYILSYLESIGVEVPEGRDIRKFFEEEFYEKAKFYHGKIYHIYDAVFDYERDEYIFESFKLENNDIGMVLHYYNGDCCFDEAFECAIDKLEGDK